MSLEELLGWHLERHELVLVDGHVTGVLLRFVSPDGTRRESVTIVAHASTETPILTFEVTPG